MAVTLAVPAEIMGGRHSFGDDQLDADREAPDRGPAQDVITEMARLLLFPDGTRKVWLRRKIIRAVRTG